MKNTKALIKSRTQPSLRSRTSMVNQGERKDRLGAQFWLTCDYPVVPVVVLEFILGLLVVSGDNLEPYTISVHLIRAAFDLSHQSFAHLLLLSKKSVTCNICQSKSWKNYKNVKFLQYKNWKSFGWWLAHVRKKMLFLSSPLSILSRNFQIFAHETFQQHQDIFVFPVLWRHKPAIEVRIWFFFLIFENFLKNSWSSLLRCSWGGALYTSC